MDNNPQVDRLETILDIQTCAEILQAHGINPNQPELLGALVAWKQRLRL